MVVTMEPRVWIKMDLIHVPVQWDGPGTCVL